MMSRLCRYAEKIFELGTLLKKAVDSRKKPQIPTQAIVASILTMFVSHRKSLNALDQDLKWPRRLDKIVGRVKPSGDRIAEVAALIESDSLREIQNSIVHTLSRNKVLKNHWPMRFVAIDGHELASSRLLRCDQCCERKIQIKKPDGESETVIEYYHRCVVAHLIGLDVAVPVDLELIRPGEGEVAAAKRLLHRLVENHPRLFDGVVGDALYFEAPMINFCFDHGKHVVLTAKGDRRLLMQDADGIFSLTAPELWEPRKGQSVRVWNADGFTSCEGVDRPMRVLRAEETTVGRVHGDAGWIEQVDVKTFSWITDIPTSLMSSRLLWEVGHHRWDIEDDLFNVLATHWAMDHSFHHHPVAIVNFLLILFTAFVLVETFFKRNLKPQLRRKFTLVALRDVIHADIVNGKARAIWLSDA